MVLRSLGPKCGPKLLKMDFHSSIMLSGAGCLLHILLVMLPNPSWHQFSSILMPLLHSKSAIFIERVINFEVFLIFLPDALLNPFCSQLGALGASSWELWGSFWRPLGASWDVLGPLGAKCSRHFSQKMLLKAIFESPNCRKRLQEASRGSKKNIKCPPNGPK